MNEELEIRIIECHILMCDALKAYEDRALQGNILFCLHQYCKALPEDVSRKIDGFVNENIQPMIYDMDYWSFIENDEKYGSYLKQKLPMEKITLHADKTGSKLYIKKNVSLITYQNFFINNEFNYSSFINYLVKHTFDPLLHRMMLEIQKDKLAKKFADLFVRYLDAD